MKIINELTDRDKYVPRRLLAALKQNREAKAVFDSMPDAKRDICIRRAKKAASRAEIDAMVSELAHKTFKDLV